MLSEPNSFCSVQPLGFRCKTFRRQARHSAAFRCVRATCRRRCTQQPPALSVSIVTGSSDARIATDASLRRLWVSWSLAGPHTMGPSKQVKWLLKCGFALAMLSHLLGCDVVTNKDHARHAKYRSEISRLLFSMEAYQATNSGRLPPSLEQLKEADTELRDIDVSPYSYSTNGFRIADSKRWLISIPDPYKKGNAIVGRLPLEVDSTTETRVSTNR
jgi:hypothetical protein